MASLAGSRTSSQWSLVKGVAGELDEEVMVSSTMSVPCCSNFLSLLKVIKLNFHVVLFIILYKVVLTVDETLVCAHSSEGY